MPGPVLAGGALSAPYGRWGVECPIWQVSFECPIWQVSFECPIWQVSFEWGYEQLSVQRALQEAISSRGEGVNYREACNAVYMQVCCSRWAAAGDVSSRILPYE